MPIKVTLWRGEVLTLLERVAAKWKPEDPECVTAAEVFSLREACIALLTAIGNARAYAVNADELVREPFKK